MPTLPWSGSDLKIDCGQRDTSQLLVVPDELYQRGCVHDVDEALESAKRIGFPVMIKASEGQCRDHIAGSSLLYSFL